MTNGYTPLFNEIVTSSIWNEDNAVRIVWITLMALSDMDGNVQASIAGLAPVARVSIPECEKAIHILSSPDPYSRSQEKEGRRIEPIDGGWHLINHRKYRQKAKSRAEYYRNWREQQKKKKKQKEENNSNLNSNSNSETQCNVAQQDETVADKVSLNDIFAYWNNKKNLPKIIDFTEQRKKKLQTRMKEKLFTESWRQAIDRISASKFCTGQNDRGWRADIDFLLENDTNYIKVLEGKYDNSNSGNSSGSDKPFVR